jgi:hypothetical protein
MDRREVVERLAGLRREVEAEDQLGIEALETSFALALWDVCGALCLTEAERTEVLGNSAIAHVRDFLGGHVWVAEAQISTVA